MTIARLLSCLLLFISSPSLADCIGVVTAGGGREFWAEVRKGADTAGRELGLRVYSRGAVDEVNEAGQQLIINAIVNRGCIGLVLAPNSPARALQVEDLKARGIPTIYIDRDMAGPRHSVIKTSNEAPGRLAGKKMVEALGGQGNVAVLRLNPNVVSTSLRERSFIEAAMAGGLNIAIDLYIGTMIDQGRAATYEVLRNRKDIQGVFTPNESTSMAVIAVLDRIDTARRMTHIGFDASKLMVKALREGRIHGFVVQNPFQMGYLGVRTLHQVLQGKPVPNDVDTGVIFVDSPAKLMPQ